ncbi:DUF3892 domain-containing protein [Pedobacter frigiditerrae]|uniref:DUF3892 domain-containing protein n=1 Tax=Pedobacter frigiditerrae TaxID=2530452 RepID=A0A4R0N1S9_9SPHI|nr:DUF3892 domain-containing protein [Pedobacter frigiditerrae]TCC93690.1 DUF3892 domain-containing protein [Pedobacter frigiditerrae]
MANTINFYISGIWQTTHNGSKIVSHVFLHANDADGFNRGVKTSREEVVKLIEAGKIVMTLRWDYHTAAFKTGAKVEIIEVGNIKYLRTHKDATVNDNLDNMIRMNAFI